LRPKLFKEDSTMDTNNPIFGDEWTTADIDWRYFSSIAKPTIASHAEDVADDDGEEDYNPAEKNKQNTLSSNKEGNTC
jgi:hypothetical protein